MSACHAEDRRFESGRDRSKYKAEQTSCLFGFCFVWANYKSAAGLLIFFAASRPVEVFRFA
jgi:hypothetical protein